MRLRVRIGRCFVLQNPHAWVQVPPSPLRLRIRCKKRLRVNGNSDDPESLEEFRRFGRRIQKVLAGVKHDDVMAALHAWEEDFEESRIFPFEAVVSEYQERGPLRSGDRVKVLHVSAVDDLYGSIVHVGIGRKRYDFPLCDLETADRESPKYQIVDDYRTWFANR